MDKRTDAEQSRSSDYVTHVQHLARRAGKPRNQSRYTRKRKHKGRGHDGS